MKAVVKKDGVLIPKRFLKGAKEVEIRKEGGHIVVLPLSGSEDPIWGLGSNPIKTGVTDASLRHDDYLYNGA